VVLPSLRLGKEASPVVLAGLSFRCLRGIHLVKNIFRVRVRVRVVPVKRKMVVVAGDEGSVARRYVIIVSGRGIYQQICWVWVGVPA
jgi:hypothetical protein